MKREKFVAIYFLLLASFALDAQEILNSTAPPTSASYDNYLVESVQIQGLKNLKEHSIRSQIKTRAGEFFDIIEAKSDLRRLTDLGIFNSADINITTRAVDVKNFATIRFDLEEKPKIKKLSIRGHKKLSKSAIREVLAPSQRLERDKSEPADFKSAREEEFKTSLEDGSFLDLNKLSAAIEEIQLKYAEKSIYESRVTWEIKEDTAANRVELTLNIQEGKIAKIAHVSVNGFSGMNLKKLHRALKAKPGVKLSSKKIEKAMSKINRIYKENGWLDFEMDYTTRPASPDEIAPRLNLKKNEIPIELTLNAREGRRHFLIDYHFEGNEELSGAKLNQLAALNKNKILQESRLNDAQGKILEAYRNKGHLFAVIDIEKTWLDEPQGLQLVFKINERQKVYIRDIFVEGLHKTKNYVIEREVLLKRGDLFSQKKLMRSQQKIFNLGFLADLRLDYEPTPDLSHVDLIFDVKEGQPGMLTAGAGFSSLDGVVGQVTVQHLNMLGRAQRLNLSSEFGKRRKSYDVSWTTPWTMDKPISTTFGLFDTDRSLQFASDATGFKKRSRGGNIFVAPRFEEDKWILGFGYSLQRDRISDVLDIYKNEIPETITDRSSFETRVTYDTRDFYLDPKEGQEHSVSVLTAGGPFGGDVHLIRPTLKHAFYIPTFTLANRYAFVMSSALRWGIVENYGSANSVTVADRFFVGGAETVRGYSYTGQIGPVGGGKAYMVGNLEYKIPMVMEGRLTIIQGALFVDFGGAWSSTKNINLEFGRGDNNLKAGIGFGIRFKTPAFPVRLDWGWGLHHKPGEAINQFYFTLGSIL